MDLERYRALREGRVSPERILEWSNGEVTVPFTINWETGTPVPKGIFDEEIFGPMNGWQDEQNASRMGHIRLVRPVVPKIFLLEEHSRLAQYLGMEPDVLYDLVHYRSRVLLYPENPADPDLAYGMVFTNLETMEYIGEHGCFPGETATGPKAVRELIRDKKQLEKPEGDADPEWALMSVIPVVPPCDRPMIPLENGKWLTSDLNDVYRKIIVHNAKIRKLMEKKAKAYMWIKDAVELQEACDELFEMLDQRYRQVN